jgi:hypothetical protein
MTDHHDLFRPSRLGRRRFLKLGGLAGAGLLNRLPTRAGDVEALGRDLKGRLILPDEVGFGFAYRPNNSVYDQDRPIGVAVCADDSDVQRCILWARDTGTPFAIRSGGHNYAGFSCTTGLLISVRAMNRVEVDIANGTVTAQGGANNQEMATALRKYPVAIPSGRCPTVGISGLALGGGWGFSATRTGLCCDTLMRTNVVLADGSKIEASVSRQPDLFWALRGGGGGNFGVTTSLTFRLSEVPTLTRFELVWAPGRHLELIRALQRIQKTHPRTLSTRSKIAMTRHGAKPSLGDLQVECLGVYWGSINELLEILQPALTLQKPTVQNVHHGDFWWIRDSLMTNHPIGLFDTRNQYVDSEISEEGIENILRWIGRWPGGSVAQENLATIFAIGGAVRDIPVSATAYPHRRSNFIFKMQTQWAPVDKPAVAEAQRSWLRDYHEDMRRFLQPGAYVNFPMRDFKDWASAYYGPNLQRLVGIKRRYDPDRIFRFPQSIPT